MVPDDDEPVENQAIRLLAERALEKREREVGPVGNRDAWMSKAVKERTAKHFLAFDAIDAPTWTPLALAERLEPELFPKPSGPQAFHASSCVCGGHGTDRTCTQTEAQ